MQGEPQPATVQERLRKLFEFLKAYTDLRYPPVRDIGQQLRALWLDTLPEHKDVELFRAQLDEESEDEDADVVLRLTRPLITNCPAPLSPLSGWLKPGWQHPDGKVDIQQSRNFVTNEGETFIERFSDDPKRLGVLRQWQLQRDEWAANERPTRRVLELFQTVYEWFGVLEREGERVELLVADGLLRCPDEKGAFCHPVLLQKLELDFHPEKRQPQFVFRKREHPPELYMEFLRALPDVNAQQLAACADELKKSEFSPLGDDDTSGFLRRLIQGLFPSGGEFVDAGTEPVEGLPSVERKPVVFMRQRRTGPGNIFDLVLEDITARFEAGETFPPALVRILGVADPLPTPSKSTTESALGVGNEDEDVLLSKPANREQLEIARQLAMRDCVLVQGPPGTGKTHTIANLLGHLLAQGKRVLVTAHTPKALRVLREKVVESLQPLCVSILQNDKQSQEELQQSVRQIHTRLSENEHRLEREAIRLRKQRHEILAQLREARVRLLEARQDEIREIVFGGQGVRPIEAAKLVQTSKERDNWIPSPVTLGVILPLSHEEVVQLYQTNARVSLEDERELNGSRPCLDPLPTPDEFQKVVAETEALRAQDLHLRTELWHDTDEASEHAEFEEMLEMASKAIEFFKDSASWQLDAVQAGRDGDPARRAWDSLAEFIEQTWREVHECNDLVMKHGPHVSDPRPAHELFLVIEGILKSLDAGHSLHFLTRLTKRHWHSFIRSIRIGERMLDPRNREHFCAVRAHLRIVCLREELCGRWERMMSVAGGPAVADLGSRPEQTCRGFVNRIRNCLEWHRAAWVPLEEKFERLGFDWSAYHESLEPEAGEHAELRRLRAAVLGDLEQILIARAGLLRLWQLESELAQWRDLVPNDNENEAQATHRLRRALRDVSVDEYRAAYEELVRLKSLEPDLVRRNELLAKLAPAASAWASAVQNRLPRHNQPKAPGDPAAAWRWRQLHDELEHRATTSLEQLQQRIEDLSIKLLEVTAQLVDKQTWLHQIQNVSDEQKQALGAYAALRKRLTKTGKGLKDADFRAAARREMTVARGAVPVWIMPLNEVAETFDPKTTRFDVVIIDEASQCDPTAMFALYLGKQTIIVGDDEQVSPVAIGEKYEDVLQLIRVHLEGVPRKEFYVGDTSIYEFARIAFSGVIQLVEHFRCAPDIIAFSNALAYRGEIKPLREEHAVTLKPHVIAHRIQGAHTTSDNVNAKEAQVVAALICAAIEQPEYAANEVGQPTTFGAVSLLGDQQALVIDRFLRDNLPPGELQRRQILCGSAAQFQGDERDVMFLSVVDSTPETPPLGLRQEGPKNIFKKRFNVAASRARDQMWVVYSLNHETDLKPGDIRRQLIEHALDPKAWHRELDKRLKQTESPFEQQVLRRLMERGYSVQPQFPVGAYRIDLVVTGGGSRLAIECDGERWHGQDKLQEDMERQAVLERLGWKFARIRGSLFFREPERAMKAVFARLEELGIPASALDTESKTEVRNELVERVVRRAEQLLGEWDKPEQQEKPSAGPRPQKAAQFKLF